MSISANEGVGSLSDSDECHLHIGTTDRTIVGYAPIPQPRPGTSSAARIYEEPAVIFDSLKSRQMIATSNELTTPTSEGGLRPQETYVCVCPETKTSTSIWRAIALNESRSPVGMH